MTKRLSNFELDKNLKGLVRKERELLHVILEHILEVDNRRLYLDKSFPSLYDYLTKDCGYSGSSAQRRIQAARLLKEVPAVAVEIKNGNLNLSQISEVSRALKECGQSGKSVSLDQKINLLQAIRGKTAQGTQKEIAKSLDLELKPIEKTSVQKDDSVHIQITLSKEQFEKLQRCKDLSASTLLSKYKDTSLSTVIEFLTDSNLKKFEVSPSAKVIENSVKENLNQKPSTNSAEKSVHKNQSGYLETQSQSHLLFQTKEHQYHSNGDRIEHRNLFKKEIKNNSLVKTLTNRVKKNLKKKLNKTLTPKTKKMVLSLDKCCQYKDPITGRQCRSTFNLEIDHKKSRWAGGDHDLKNLQVLCKGHNNLKYRNETNLRFF